MPTEEKFKVGDKVMHQGKIWTVKDNWKNTCFGVVLCQLEREGETITWTNQTNLEKANIFNSFVKNFELYAGEPDHKSKAIESVVDQLLNPVEFSIATTKSTQEPYFIIQHFDGVSVTNTMKIEGRPTWMATLKEFISFLRGLGYSIKNKDIALNINRESDDWQGAYYECN